MNTSHYPTKLFVITLAAIAAPVLSACGAQFQSPVVFPTATLSPAQQVQLQQVCSTGGVAVILEEGGDPIPCPTGAAPAATTSAATAAPGATSAAPSGECTGYTLVWMIRFGESSEPIVQNMDVGDSKLWSVVQAWNTADPASTFMAVIEPGQNLDFEADKIAGTYWFFTGTAQAVQCRANEMWTEAGASAYKLYVGSAYATPADWQTSFPASWTMKVWQYEDPAIEVEGSSWETVTVLRTNTTHAYGDADAFGYGQLWNGVNASVVYHFVVRPGWEMSTPKYQGTVWVVSGINSWEGKELLQDRFDQMTQEVISRDDRPKVYMYYCGVDTPEGGWTTTLPAGWKCERLP